MRHFTLSEAARRYDEYRPKVHGIAKEWINDAAGKSSFGRGLNADFFLKYWKSKK
jgi:hypothetical protein